jgi:hypothetical protein
MGNVGVVGLQRLTVNASSRMNLGGGMIGWGHLICIGHYFASLWEGLSVGLKRDSSCSAVIRSRPVPEVWLNPQTMECARSAG